MTRRIPIGAMLAACALALAACGSSQTVNVSASTTISKGQELTDLQRALNEGALSQAEYDKLREKILRRPN